MQNDPIQSLKNYLNQALTPYHATHGAAKRLEERGYTRLHEDRDWPSLEPGGTYYLKRTEGSLLAFHLPNRPLKTLAKEAYFHIWAAHTDSPCLKINPHGFFEKEGYLQGSIDIYGAPLIETWFDRELKAAGLVWTRPSTKAALQGILVELSEPLWYLPNLAIHLSRDASGAKMERDLNAHTYPIYGLKNQKSFMDCLARAARVKTEDVVAYDLFLVDAQTAGHSGVEDVFLHASRLDNLSMCHAGLEGFLDAQNNKRGSPPSTDKAIIRVLVLFDHEEIGSVTNTGAASSFLEDNLKRIYTKMFSFDSWDGYLACLHRSFLMSADVANAVHPNVPSAYEARYKPVIGGGPVLKFSARRSYMTSGFTEAFCHHIAKVAQVPLQRFVGKPASPVGKTIGPLLASRLGLDTADIGSPILSMHSIRETMGSDDHVWMIAFAKSFFETESLKRL